MGPATTKLVPTSVQLAFTRQDVKERGERDDAGRRSDDSTAGYPEVSADMSPMGGRETSYPLGDESSTVPRCHRIMPFPSALG